MNKHIIYILVLVLASLGCLQTTMPATIANTSEPAASPETPMEDPAGAVFQIPAEWEDAQPTARPYCATVTASEALHLRAEPNDKAQVLAYLKNGEQVRILDVGAWWKIEAQGKTGYANAKYLQEGCEP
jgi:uncharacterized protein YgiM (DUF1202 family)